MTQTMPSYEIGPVRISKAKREGMRITPQFETFVLSVDAMTHALDMVENYARKVAKEEQEVGQKRELIMYLGRACAAQAEIENLPPYYSPMKLLSRDLLLNRLENVTKIYGGSK